MNNNYTAYLQSKSSSPLTIANYTKYINMALDYIGKPESEIAYMDLVNWKTHSPILNPTARTSVSQPLKIILHS